MILIIIDLACKRKYSSNFDNPLNWTRNDIILTGNPPWKVFNNAVGKCDARPRRNLRLEPVGTAKNTNELKPVEFPTILRSFRILYGLGCRLAGNQLKSRFLTTLKFANPVIENFFLSMNKT